MGTLVDNGICLINLICRENKPQTVQGPLMSMYFYDDTDDWPEYKVIKDDIHRWEVAHLEFRKELREAEVACASDPANQDLRAKVNELKIKLKETEKRLNESLNMYR